MTLDPNPVVRQVVAEEPAVHVVAATPVVEVPAQPVVVQQQLQPVRRVRRSWGLYRAWDSVVVGIIGTALLLIGLIALVRAGTDGPWDQPVVEVLGFTHTAILGIIEIAFGVCLLLSAVSAQPCRGDVLRRPARHRRVRRRRAGRVVQAHAGAGIQLRLVVGGRRHRDPRRQRVVPRVLVTRTATSTYVERTY